MADISIKFSKNERNPVSIIPFSDSDKDISLFLQKILNKELEFDNDLKYKYIELNENLMREIL